MVIQRLSESTINQIAAGEVVENPASVVKELIENSIDAKSSSITIKIKGGGFSLIEISDDGYGMSEEDLLLSVERHATSKLKSGTDLIKIMTQGFRGEALASICAISKTRISTSQKEVGATLTISGGKREPSQSCARSRGPRPRTAAALRRRWRGRSDR